MDEPEVIFDATISEYTDIFEMDPGASLLDVNSTYTPFARIFAPRFCTIQHIYEKVVEDLTFEHPPTFSADGKIAYTKIWNKVTEEYNTITICRDKPHIEVFVAPDLGIGMVEDIFSRFTFRRIKKYNNFFAKLAEKLEN